MARRPAGKGLHFVQRALHASRRANKPVAFIIAGHNGSGKSTLWHELLANSLRIPLINADRLTMSILPQVGGDGFLPGWAAKLRDQNARWQLLSQQGVQLFTGLVMRQRLPFAFETVFSHWKRRADGSYESKADIIRQLRAAGYFVVLVFVGLVSADLSEARVQTRRLKGGHAVPQDKLRQRFPRTQQAIRHAAPLADWSIMFDNSLDIRQAFSLARVQIGKAEIYDCRRDPLRKQLGRVASTWLSAVAP